MSTSPQPNTVIVIFGAAVRPDGGPSGTLRRRVEAAAACGRCFARPLFIPTGAIGRYGPSEASVMAEVLRAQGVPADAIRLEETGTDTLSSVRAVTSIMRGLPRVPVRVATSAYHLPRCLLLLRLAGVRCRACAPPRAPAATRRWQRWYWRLREVPAVPYDTALVLWLRLTGRV